MKNFRKVIAMVLVLALTVAMSVAGTIAYLQDDDSAKNIMTLGNVKIYQNEQQKIIDDEVDNDKQHQYIREEKDGLEDFEQNKKLLPAVNVIPEGEGFVVEDKEIGENIFNPGIKNVVDKFVSVTNYGTEAAYIRTIIAFEGGHRVEYVEGTDEIFNEYNLHDKYIGVNGTYDYLKDEDGDFVTIELNGVEYTLAVCVYEEPVAAGATTDTSLRQIYLTWDAGNEAYDLFGDKYDILVLSQGVQVAGFDSAEQALDTAFGEVTAANAAAWLVAVA